MFEMGSPLQYLIYGYFTLVLVAATTVINAELRRRRKSRVKYDLLDRLVSIVKLQRDLLTSPETPPDVKRDAMTEMRETLVNISNLAFPLESYSGKQPERMELPESIRLIVESMRLTKEGGDDNDGEGNTGVRRRILFRR
jgi:hypothetical protein